MFMHTICSLAERQAVTAENFKSLPVYVCFSMHHISENNFVLIIFLLPATEYLLIVGKKEQ